MRGRRDHILDVDHDHVVAVERRVVAEPAGLRLDPGARDAR